MNKLFTQLVAKRGLNDDFLRPKYEDLTPVDEILDIKKATNRIKKAIEKQEKILIYGDYDVDGVTASALLEKALLLAGADKNNLEIMLPDRFIDGYGMSPRLIEQAKKDKIDLVITVDCGSLNHDIVDELNLLKIDTIITDHHECGDTLPDAVAVINPKRHDFPEKLSTLKNLAGVGVAFELARALKDEGLVKDGQEKWLLDLVLIGTICDSMTIVGENRILCYYGVKVLAKTRVKGLKELIKNAGLKTITSESIGFQLGPRLNAAGRLETATLSLELLRTDSAATAADIAAKLEILNKKRRDEQRAAMDEIKKRREGSEEDAPVIIETGHWHEGIIGIVAGRLVEEYHKPAFVLTEVEDGIYKGSGRSFGDFHLSSAIDFTRGILLGGGGHAAAAGVQLEAKNLYTFREKIAEYYKSLHLKDQEKFLKSHYDLEVDDFSDINMELIEGLSLLEPFGAGNEEPIFRLKNIQIIESSRMGDKKQHLRLELCDKKSKTMKCVAFFAKKEWFTLDQDTKYDFLIKPVLNEFRGVKSVELRLVDIL